MLITLTLMSIAGIVAEGQSEPSQVWKELRSTPLFSDTVRCVWRATYRSVAEYQVDDMGDPVVVPIEGSVPTSQFGLEETVCGDEHHIVMRPIEVANQHRSSTFARGMEFWSVDGAKDVVITHDQRAAQLSSGFARTYLIPNDLSSPQRLLRVGLSPDPAVWGSAYFDYPRSEGTPPRVVRQGLRAIDTGDASLIGTQETAEFPDLMSQGKPVTVSRDIYYSKAQSMIPVRVDFRYNGQLLAQWRLRWSREVNPGTHASSVRGYRISSLEADNLAVGFGGRVVATATYELDSAEALTPAAVAAGLTPRIPEGYAVVDVDAARAEVNAASAVHQPSESTGWKTLLAAAATATTLVIVLVWLSWRRTAPAPG